MALSTSRRSTILFFLIAFGIPWTGWITLAVAGIDRSSTLATFLFFAGDACSLAGFIAIYSAGGWHGVKELLRRCVQWPVSIVWWVYALFLPALWVTVAILIYAFSSGAAKGSAPGIGGLKPSEILQYGSAASLFAFLTGPLGEEAGWRGFLLPRLLEKYSAVASSFILGIIWAIWHYPLYYNTVFSTLFGAANFTISVICLSFLFTILFIHTRGSVLLAIFLHWSTNVTPVVFQAIFPDVNTDNRSFEIIQLVVLVLLTACFAYVFLIRRGGTRPISASGNRE